MTLTYMSGFGSSFESEAVPGALPVGRNSPQRPPLGLYAEQLSGTAFTAPRAMNRRIWVYRIQPGVRHSGPFEPVDDGLWRTAPNHPEAETVVGQLRWGPGEPGDAGHSFVTGLRTITTCGDAAMQSGMAAHLMLADRSMTNEYLVDVDAELLIIPQQGGLRIRTELGVMEIEPGEIGVVPRGMIFAVELLDGQAYAYVCENYGAMFTLPERGPIGANGLANTRDFLTPVAAYEDREIEGTLFMRVGGRLYRTALDRSPFDVVGWHGNYVPYKYDLRRFMAVGAVHFDHPDPSIFTVLTSPSEVPGTANVDFVIFPDRWSVSEDTFRPPWYHRNFMSEFMGLVYGVYDAKPDGFVPGGMSLHNMMLPHGPDATAFEKASSSDLEPVKIAGSLAFMLETRFAQKITRHAAELPTRDAAYPDCWRELPRHFTNQV